MPTSILPPDILLADKAITQVSEDHFQRYPFARHLATTICERRSADSLVIGLYGKWGSGKSSVLNFITAELANTDVLTVYFNPWRFEDEEHLLLGFFSELSAALETVATPEAREVTRKALATYSKKVVTRLQLLDRDPTSETLHTFKSQAKLEGLKQQVNESLRALGKRVLVLIDDIDRLSAHEIQAILRLVKLTGDFHYTTYLLAFDEKVVAQAVGERYASNGKKTGRRYLEKIIQVPLHLPLIQKEAMQKFFQEGFSRSLALTNTSLSDEGYQRLVWVLATGIMPRVTTPRHVTRYCNTLLVVLPLLRGEANVVDLMLLEALKQFYPKLYKVVAHNQKLLTGAPQNTSVRDLKAEYEPVFGPDGNHIGEARNVLYSLFPKLANALGNSMFFQNKVTEDELYTKQAVASSYYFRRYFSYAVQEGEIPDGDFSNFLAVMGRHNVSEAAHLAKLMIARSNDKEFMLRLEKAIGQVSYEQAQDYCRLLLDLEENFSASVVSERIMRALSIVGTLYLSYITLLPENEVAEVTVHILTNAAYRIAYELFWDITRVGHWSDDHRQFEQFKNFIRQTNYEVFRRIIVSRGLAEAGTTPWYEAFAGAAPFFLTNWTQAFGKEQAEQSLREIFTANPSAIKLFLQNICPWGQLDGVPSYVNVGPETYELLKEHLDVHYLYQVALSVIGDEEPMPYMNDVFHRPTETERLHQLIHLYRQDATNTLA